MKHQTQADTEPISFTPENQPLITADVAQLDREDQLTPTLHIAIDSHLPNTEFIVVTIKKLL